MTDDDSIKTIYAGDRDDREALTTAPHTDPEYPHIPYPIIRPARGSPYYIHPRTGKKADDRGQVRHIRDAVRLSLKACSGGQAWCPISL